MQKETVLFEVISFREAELYVPMIMCQKQIKYHAKISYLINGKGDCKDSLWKLEYINCKDILCDIALYIIKTG